MKINPNYECRHYGYLSIGKEYVVKLINGKKWWRVKVLDYHDIDILKKGYLMRVKDVNSNRTFTVDCYLDEVYEV